jgi:hypothetical protein
MNKVSRSMIINFTLIWQLLKQKIKETVEEKEREESDHEVIEGTELEAVKQIIEILKSLKILILFYEENNL